MSLISVVVCSHNPRPDFLGRTLAALQGQSLPKTQWEFVLIDNASQEPLSQQWDLSWHPAGRHVREKELGITFARLRAITETRGGLLVFVDDDNVLRGDYLERVANIASCHPEVGAFGAGVLQPEFEVQPRRELLPFISMLALRTVTRDFQSANSREKQNIPWGAGLCVRRSVAKRYYEVVKGIETAHLFLERRGSALFCGGDDLFSWIAVGLEYSFGLFPELRLTHLIAARRLCHSYFLSLIHDHAFSHGILQYLLFRILPTERTRFWRARTLLHGLRRGGFSMRCRQARLSGNDRARRFVIEQHLQPIASQIFPDGLRSPGDMERFVLAGSLPRECPI